MDGAGGTSTMPAPIVDRRLVLRVRPLTVRREPPDRVDPVWVFRATTGADGAAAGCAALA